MIVYCNKRSMITPEAWTPVIINIYYLYIYLFICWKSKIIVKNAYIVFYWAQKQSFAPKYSQRTECVDNSVKSLRGSNYNYADCTQHDYSVHEGTTPKIHSFSGWHSVIKEFQKEIHGSSTQVTCFFLSLFGRGFSEALSYIQFLQFSWNYM